MTASRLLLPCVALEQTNAMHDEQKPTRSTTISHVPDKKGGLLLSAAGWSFAQRLAVGQTWGQVNPGGLQSVGCASSGRAGRFVCPGSGPMPVAMRCWAMLRIYSLRPAGKS